MAACELQFALAVDAVRMSHQLTALAAALLAADVKTTALEAPQAVPTPMVLAAAAFGVVSSRRQMSRRRFLTGGVIK